MGFKRKAREEAERLAKEEAERLEKEEAERLAKEEAERLEKEETERLAKEEAERLLYLCLKEGWLEDALEKVRREADELMDEIIRKSNFK